MDEQFLKETLRLAKKGMSWTNPNPMVGALIVKDGHAVARGYHLKSGLPHAEIEAIRNAKNLQGATLYLNLEPCNHFGKTKPCVDSIISSGIKRVVCATADPNPKVHGKGITSLRKAGIDTTVGVLEREARTLNEAFFTYHEKKRPFIALKFAASLDGKIATREGHSKWITNEKARDYARSLRAQYQAVLIGINTILQDDPHLGIRIKGFKDPIRIILDSNLRIPLTSKVLRNQNVLIAIGENADQSKRKLLEKKGVPIITFQDNEVPLPKLLKELVKREIISVLVEGGGKTLGSFLMGGFVDKVYAFHAPILIGDGMNAFGGKGVKSGNALRLQNVTFKKFGDNILTIGYNV